MNRAGRHIDRYPQLAAWYDANTSARRLDARSPATNLVMTICSSLAHSSIDANDREPALILIKGIDSFVRESMSPVQDYLEADTIICNDDITLSEVISQVSEQGTSAGLGPHIQTSIMHFANAVQFAAMRFLSGWIALNNSNFKLCLDECEKISEPFASVYTLMGQASLELGDIQDAIESLNVATSLDANEPMSWFQLAKAHHVSDNQSKAWEALDRVEQLTGPDLEVSSMRAFVALHEPRNSSYLDESWRKLQSLAGNIAIHPSLAGLMIEISFARSDLEGTRRIIEGMNFLVAATDPDFRKGLPRLLRRLQEFGRMDLASTLLDRILNATAAESLINKQSLELDNKKGA